MLLLCQKSYKNALQRSFIYLTTTTLILEVFLAMQIEHQFSYQGQDEFCSALGYLIQLSGGVNYMLTLGITFLLVYIVYKQLRRDPFPFITNSKSASRLLEVVFVTGAILIPTTYTWVPFLHENYGLAGAYCWIRGIDENCMTVGSTEQFAFYGIAEAVGLTSVVAVVGLSVVYCRLAYKYKSTRRSQLTLIRQTLILMSFLVAHVVILSIGLAVRFITQATGKTGNFSLWFLNAAGIPVSLLVIPTGFVVHINSTGMRTLFTRCFGLLCCKSRKRPNYFDCNEDMNTNPTSHPIQIPSETRWTVPYTDGFTVIDDLEKIL